MRPWLATETIEIMKKVGRLTQEEREAHLVPGSRSIAELMDHLVDPLVPDMGNDRYLHQAFHLGEINVLFKLALAKRECQLPKPEGA